MSHFSDPTANAAIGSVDREIKMTRRRAEQLKRRHQKKPLTPQELALAQKQFVGIHRRFLREAQEDCMLPK